MIYLDNAATSFPKPPQVGAAMTRFLAEDAANPGRAGHSMAVRAERLLDDVREKLARLVNAANPRRMIFTLNGTDALNMALKGALKRASLENWAAERRPHVITTVLEHNSVSRPLDAMAAAGNVDLTRVGCSGEGFVDPDDVRAAIRPNTLMVVMTHASNVLGSIQDAAAIGAIARDHDLLFCLDAAQTVGILDLDVDAMQIDLLAFPGHKGLLGPTGTGALYVGERARLEPWREGGTGGDSASPLQPEAYPWRLEGGTPNTVGIAGLGAAVDYVLERGPAATLEHERRLAAAISERLRDDPRFAVHGPAAAERRVGPLSIGIAGVDPNDAGAILDDSFGIAVRPGLHCAPWCHRALGTFPAGTLRISPGPFNTEEDVEALLQALEQIADAST